MVDKPAPLAVRALNFWRTVHIPTYLGIRLMLEPQVGRRTLVAGDTGAKWIDELARRKASRGSCTTYANHRILKQLSAGKHEYRDCLASSPMTALMEAWLLDILSKLSEFSTSFANYAYRWPSSGAGRMFDYYWNGYSSRNRNIREALQVDPGHVAVVCDIRRFYPSIDRARVLAVFQDKLVRGLDVSLVDSCINIARGYLMGDANDKGVGIPIGPPLSHVFGTLALRNLDAALQQRYGLMYSRYVDDICVVCKKEDSQAVLSEIKGRVEAEGLALHEGKVDLIAAKVWADNAPGVRPEWGVESGFDELTRRIEIFLAAQPEQYVPLRERFRESGIALPLSRLRALTGGRKWFVLKKFVPKNPLWTLAAMGESCQGIMQTVATVRQRLVGMFDSAIGALSSGGIQLRKWQVQRVRHVVNRLMYVGGPKQFERMIEGCSAVEELEDIVCVLKALQTGDLSDIVKMPGTVASAYAALAHEIGIRGEFSWKEDPSRELIDALVPLIVYRIVVPPREWVQRCGASDRALLKFALMQSEVVAQHDFSYTDELKTLLLGNDRPSYEQFLFTQFDNHEELTLEALHMLGNVSYG